MYAVLERFRFISTRLKINVKCRMCPEFEYFKLWNKAEEYKKKNIDWKQEI